MGRPGLFSRNDIRKRNQQKHLDAGLCRFCSKKAIENKDVCEYHFKYRQEQSKKYSQNTGRSSHD